MIKKIFFSVLLLILTTMLISCNEYCVNNISENTHENQKLVINEDSINNLESVSFVVAENFEVRIDPCVELSIIAQYLSGAEPYTKLESEYKARIDLYFDEYKNHDSINQIRKIHKQGFNYSKPFEIMISCSFENSIQLSPSRIEIFEEKFGEGAVESYIDNLNDFAEVSNYNNFYNSEKEFYNSILDDVSKKFQETSCIKDLEHFYGYNQNSYTVILSTLLHTGGYGTIKNYEDGVGDIYSILGPDLEGGTFSNPTLMLYHEFGHSFVNYLSEANKSEISKYSFILKGNESKLSARAYQGVETVINEYIVRVVDVKIKVKLNSNIDLTKYYDYEEVNGFEYIRDFDKAIGYYLENRDIYNEFSEYYLELLSNINEHW